RQSPRLVERGGLSFELLPLFPLHIAYLPLNRPHRKGQLLGPPEHDGALADRRSCGSCARGTDCAPFRLQGAESPSQLARDSERGASARGLGSAKHLAPLAARLSIRALRAVVALDPGAHDSMSQDTSAVRVTALRSARRAGSREWRRIWNLVCDSRKGAVGGSNRQLDLKGIGD